MSLSITVFIINNQSTNLKGGPHDLFEIKTLFREICDLLKKAGINLDGLFLNADRTGGPAGI